MINFYLNILSQIVHTRAVLAILLGGVIGTLLVLVRWLWQSYRHDLMFYRKVGFEKRVARRMALWDLPILRRF